MKHRTKYRETYYSYLFKKSLDAVNNTKQRRAEEQWRHLEPSEDEVDDYLMKGVDVNAGWGVEFDAVDEMFFEFDNLAVDPENFRALTGTHEDGH